MARLVIWDAIAPIMTSMNCWKLGIIMMPTVLSLCHQWRQRWHHQLLAFSDSMANRPTGSCHFNNFLCIQFQWWWSFLFPGCSGEADVAFLIDSSANTNYQDFDQTRRFVSDEFIAQFEISNEKTRVAVVTTGRGGQVDFRLNTYYERMALLGAMANIQFTNEYADIPNALQLLYDDIFSETSGMRVGFPHILVIMVSDRTYLADQRTQELATMLRNDKSVTIFMVTYGPQYNSQYIQQVAAQIASSPADHFAYSMQYTSQYSSVRDTMRTRLCQEIPGTVNSRFIEPD